VLVTAKRQAVFFVDLSMHSVSESRHLQRDLILTVIKKTPCAARAFYDCPAIISHRPRSQNISKEPQLNPEKDSRIKRPRSHVSLEKSSQNYKPLDK
jgi:hypothetical protein